MSMANELLKLQQLKEAGVLNDEEFAEAKRAVLASGSAKRDPAPEDKAASLTPAQRGEANAALLALWVESAAKYREPNGGLLTLSNVKAALDRGADPNVLDHNGWTALLMLTISTGNVESARCLIDAGADLDVRTRLGGRTALMHAASKGNFKMVELLINAGANKTITDAHGKTARSYANFSADAWAISQMTPLLS